MSYKQDIQKAFNLTWPIMLGYVAIGLPCGILSASVGLNPLQVFLLSVILYSGAGQFMICNMLLAGAPLLSIVASVALVNTRHMLYSASFAPYFQKVSKRLAFLFAASVTDESYGVSIEQFDKDTSWNTTNALFVNIFANSAWTGSCVLGVLIGSAITAPIAIASFAMTSIFICLLVTQKLTGPNLVACALAALAVFTCKTIGLGGPAILIGSLVGVMGAFLFSWVWVGR